MGNVITIAVIVGKMDSGGKKNLIMEYYRKIDRKKIQFDFICDSDSQAIPKEEIERLGGKVYKIHPYQNIILNMWDIYKLCKDNKYIIVHAYNSTMNIFPMLCAKMAGVPVRISENLSMAHKGELKTVLKKILRLMSKRFATHYMACGEDCGRWLFGDKLFNSGKVSVFKTAIDTNKNLYDSELRKKTRKKYEIENKIVIGHIGRFVQQKNPLFMLEVFSEISKREKNAILLLIGDGNLKKEIIKKIDELSIKEHVMYLGRREDIHQFYNAMDAFLLPSLYEGLPVVGLEAQSCGLPVFFSAEITKEASVCPIGIFIGLDVKASEWAKRVLDVVYANIPVRHSWSEEIINAGFDSKSESNRMQRYYFDTLRSVNLGEK